MNDDESPAGCFVFVVAVAVTLAIFLAVQGEMWSENSHAYQIEAVRYGAAEWRTSETGVVTFHWKEVKP